MESNFWEADKIVSGKKRKKTALLSFSVLKRTSFSELVRNLGRKAKFLLDYADVNGRCWQEVTSNLRLEREREREADARIRFKLDKASCKPGDNRQESRWYIE